MTREELANLDRQLTRKEIMKDAYERFKKPEGHLPMNKPEFYALCDSMSYEAKIHHAIDVARKFYDTIVYDYGANVHVSVGGLDSITLLLFLRKYIDPDIKSVSASVLEYKSVQDVHKQIGIDVYLKPIKSKTEILREFGFPVISKEKAHKISILQEPNAEKQTFIHAIMTGDMGEQGHYEHSDKIKLPDKWLRLFAGYYNDHRPDLDCKIAPFKVSSDCCYWMKELPADLWAEENNSFPYLGLMASEHGQREMGLIKNGCNYFGKSTVRSCPFARFSRQDLLQLALDLNVPVPTIYGTIERKADGTLYTTRAQRTGCAMCGFGIHLEKRPHRFDRLREENEKEWDFWMNRCVTDEETGEKYGWGRVLDYIGIEWRDKVDSNTWEQVNLLSEM